MTEVQFENYPDGKALFFIEEANNKIAEMEVAVKSNELIAYHTEVDPAYEDQGLAKKLLGVMVEHAREHNLKVVPLCRFVLIQFKRNPAEYADLWQEEKSGYEG
ncbi:N-acetyltransferase [Segetibacter sp. 3557_3]|uniref:GNAT family N-acetyltransferase n=1 Tax=Segetibacter sp. 3557_3 TaxID=2547429 RepID=UPI001058BB97|nr:GNAT family N-acetyltransferase [Segetibacter sp. 3557_3]TDH25160.1 N-acetyltransferase [Segetibacter sp. 3557_3]